MTSFYKRADSDPIVIERVKPGTEEEGVQSTINMQLKVNGFFIDMILPKTFGVRYYMKKEPFTTP